MRPIEFRRAPRPNERGGRRISDGRSWIEGEPEIAIRNGWIVDPEGRHICPSCQSINH